MKNIKWAVYFLVFIVGISASAQFLGKNKSKNPTKDYPQALVSYDDFKQLVAEVENHRKARLVNLDEFLQMSQEENTIILDARSQDKYELKHIKGAINLPFTEFTQSNLEKVIPDNNTRILIYCNNNFGKDPFAFASKVFIPQEFDESKKTIMLALNIPTYLNLYGYNYKNVYELDELIDLPDPRILFEISSTPKKLTISTND
ncbi:MAG: rhodanese-like domain-containing protein [Chitinophagales bacterium]|nr:rhodanese-like domain-containing protein [Bacteroidota bacterium]MCB9042480.1 rhodanese-like domain-containing protein [Chitinophagales bacterium]